MPDETQKTNGMWLPYPLLGFILTVTIVLGSGLAGLFIQVNSLQTTLLLRDNDYSTKTKELKDRIELLTLQVGDLQVKEARRDEREKREDERKR